MKQTPRRQFLILIINDNLQEIDLDETSKRTALIEQALVVYGTLCLTLS